MRPKQVVVVTGTGTEVGKTWVAARLTRQLTESGSRVVVRKPAQSFDAADELTDAHLLADASGGSAESVCPPHRWYPVPMAPPMAAEALGLEPPAIQELLDELEGAWPAEQVDVGIVEGAGGVASPQAVDGDTADLARSLRADRVVLVADAGLGTINAVRLSVAALAPIPVLVLLNRYDNSDALHGANRSWLQARNGVDVAVDVDGVAAWIRHPS